MPRISHFLGISIYMYYRDHAPPHFHAVYDSHEVWVAIHDLSVLKGHIHPRALGLVMEWAALRRPALERNWRLARAHEPLDQVEPLE